jgi:hypothetical protein
VTPKVSPGSDKARVKLENIVPGQKIKVTVVEGKVKERPKPTPTPTPTPKPSTSKNDFKVTNNDRVKVVPTPSGSKAAVGITNLKPGQKIKVTVKTGGSKK